MRTVVGGSSGTAWSRPVRSRNVTGCWSRPLLIRLNVLHVLTQRACDQRCRAECVVLPGASGHIRWPDPWVLCPAGWAA